MIQFQIDADHLIRGLDRRMRERHDDREEVPTFAITQISTTHLPADVLKSVSRNNKAYLKASCNTGKTTGQRWPLDPIRALIVANGSALRGRTRNRFEPGWLFASLLGFGNQRGITMASCFQALMRVLHDPAVFIPIHALPVS